MKKVILGLSAFFFCAVGFAQVTDTNGNSSPTPQAAVVLGGTSATGNAGESIQNGNDNRVRVRQAGSNQSAYSVQNDGSGDGGNLARIMQTGSVTGASGFANAADVRQSGTANQSTTNQQGDLNEAVTRQGQNDDGSEGNRAYIQQGVANQAESNFAAIDQDGDDNQAYTLQTYDNSDAWTQQVGNDNWSRIRQDAGPNGTDGHIALVEQTGDDNASDIAQSGAGARNSATAVQLGDGNYAKQIQTTTATAGGVGNEALVAQGDGSVATDLNATIFFGQLDAVDDVTNGGFSGSSFNGIAFQNQSGEGNDAEIHQFGDDGVDGNYAEQNQGGLSNDTYIIQNAFGNPNGGANYARQDQDDNASNSQAGIAQNGFNHKAYQRQTGDDNNVMSTQRGNGNIMNSYQDGNQNRATTAQRGRDNQIHVVQRGGHSFVGTQNLPNGSPVGAPNGSNVMDILQLGPAGNFHTDAIDCVIPEAMEPMPTPNIGTFNIDKPCPDC